MELEIKAHDANDPRKFFAYRYCLSHETQTKFFLYLNKKHDSHL